jgi:hypothetical protein
MNERKTQWNYPLLGVSENKMGERTSTPSKNAYEMIGADFSVKGGLRPHHGFKKVYGFSSSRLIEDFFPVSFRVGIGQYGYGFIYKSQQTGDATKSDIYIDYYVKDLTAPTGDGTYSHTDWSRDNALITNVETSDPMSVAVFGRYIYITQLGMETVLFHIEYASASQATSVLTITDNDAIQNSDTAATGTIEFTGVATADTTITLIDHEGTSKTYIAKGSGSNGDVVTGGITFLNIGDKNDNASALKDTIAHTNGHNGTIVGVWSAGTGEIDLTQSAVGPSGNTTMVSDLDNCTISGSFSGGGLTTTWESKNSIGYLLKLTCAGSNTGFYNGTFVKGVDANTTATNIKTAVDASSVEDSLTVERTDNVLTFTQLLYGKGGNQVVTLSGNTWATKNNFSGGAGPTPHLLAPNAAYFEHKITDTGPGTRPLLLGAEDQTNVGELGDPASPAEVNGHVFTRTSVGTWWDETPTDQLEPASLEAGSYSVAYRLEDPNTGRITSISEIAAVKEDHLSSKATGRLTVNTGTAANFDPGVGEKIVISDSVDGANGHTVTFEFSVTHTDSTKITNTHYIIGIKDLTTTTAIASKIYDAVALAKTNKDLDITSIDPAGSLSYVDLEHDRATTDGNELITFDGDSADLTYTGMSGAANFDPGYIGVEIIWDFSKYSKAHIYRSVKVENAGGVYAGSVLQLDQVITLNDYTITNQDGVGSGNRRAIYYFTKEDLALLYMPPYTDRTLFDAEMPKAGACINFDGIMLTSNASGTVSSSTTEDRLEDRYRGVGEFRWSSLANESPELFPPENYFSPSKIANEVIHFEKSGGSVLGFANNIIMHISREIAGSISYLKVLPIHEGYGIVNKNSAVTVGPQTLYVNDKSIKSIDAQGKLDTLHALDGIVEDWKDDLANYVSISFDSQSLTLYMLNSNKKQATVMWFGTSSVSELYDLPFDLTKTGSWPLNLSDADSDLTEYSMFLQQHPGGADLTSENFYPSIWVADSKRERTISGSLSSDFNGKARTTLLDGTGDTRFKVESYAATGEEGEYKIELNGDHTGHGTLPPTIDGGSADNSLQTGNFVGAYVYITNSTSGIGEKAQIRHIQTSVNTAGKLEFTGSGVTTVDTTITLISTDGTSKTYIADDDISSTGDLDAEGRVKFYNGGDKNDHASILRTAILSSNGHNGKIVATWSAGTGIITLAQATPGAGGNSTITSDLNECTVTQFSGASTSISVINTTSGFTLTAGDRIAISPVYVRWSGSLLGYNDAVSQENPSPGGLHKVRLADSLSAYFSSVDGAPTLDTVDSGDLFYRGIIFEGDSNTYKSTGIPTDLSGTVVKSIVDGESTNWVGFETHGVRGMALSPGIEVFCPDLDFRLLSVIIEGKVMSTLRTERAT